MKLHQMKILTGFLLGGFLMVPAFGAQDASPKADVQTPQIGSINFVQGQVSLDGQALGSQDVGSAVLQAGEVLETSEGRAEMLLTPGAFVRLDNGTAVELVSPSQNEAEIGLDRGRIAIEIANVGEGVTPVRVTEKGIVTDLTEKGLYEFDANRGEVYVYSGNARVNDNGSEIQMGQGRYLALDANELRPAGFNPESLRDDFYKFNEQRSNQLAQANQDVAPSEVGNSAPAPNATTSDSDAYDNGYDAPQAVGPVPVYGPAWYGPGWYWDPYFSMYTWVPGAGLYYSPFGFGFYSPVVIYRTPLFYRSHFFIGGYSRFYGRPFYGREFYDRGRFDRDRFARERFGHQRFEGRTFGTIPPRVRPEVAPRGNFSPRISVESRGGFATRGGGRAEGGFRGGFGGGARSGGFHGGGGSHGGGQGRGH